MVGTAAEGGLSVRDKLFRMWELPATWALLRFSSPAGARIPDLGDIANALVSPKDHLDIIAALHARPLNIPPSSAATRWLPGLRRAVRQRRRDFDPIFGAQRESSDSESESEVSKEVAQGGTEDDDEDDPLASLDSYFSLTPEERLETLHTIAELGACDAEVAPVPSGRVAELEVDQLRLEPIGTDAAGNDYWYFGDCAHIFREPGRRVRKPTPAEARRAAEEAKLRQEEERKAKIAERKKVAAEKRAQKQAAKEERARKRQEELLARRAKWAPRAATARVTRASRAAAAAANAGARSADAPVTKLAGNKRARSDSGSDDENAEFITDAPRASTRQRRPTPAMQEHKEDTATATTPRRKSTGSVVTEAVRHCVRWELVSSNLEELRQFVEKFEDPENIFNRNERKLITYFTDELIPAFEEVESKLRKERQKRERNEWLMVNQKRSSRVQAIEARRDAEKEREKEREEELRKEELRLQQRRLDIAKQMEEFARTQMKELRAAKRSKLRPDQTEEARRLLELDLIADRDAQRRRESAVGKRGAAVSTRVLRSRRDSEDGDVEDGDDVPDAEEEDDYEPESEHDSEPESVEDDFEVMVLKRPGPDVMEIDCPKKEEGGTVAPMEVEPVNRTLKSEQQLNGSNPEDFAKRKHMFTSASAEEDIPTELTVLTNNEDGLPTRLLNYFIFINKDTCSEVPVETVDNKEISVVALGVLAPRKDSEVDPLRVEIHGISEWAIEYGWCTRIWVKTKTAWYELVNPHIDYRPAYSTTLRKFEICVRLVLLGDAMKPAALGYEDVLDMLGQRYNEMKKYKESDIRAEYSFILSQVDELKHSTLLKCGFIKELRSWKRAEDRKARNIAKKSAVKNEEMESRPEDISMAAAGGSSSKAKRRRSSRGQTPSSRGQSPTPASPVEVSSAHNASAPSKNSDEKVPDNAKTGISIDLDETGNEIEGSTKAPNSPQSSDKQSNGEEASDAAEKSSGEPRREDDEPGKENASAKPVGAFSSIEDSEGRTATPSLAQSSGKQTSGIESTSADEKRSGDSKTDVAPMVEIASNEESTPVENVTEEATNADEKISDEAKEEFVEGRHMSSSAKEVLKEEATDANRGTLQLMNE